LADSALARLRRALPGARWAPEGGQMVSEMRLVKEPAELALVRKAGEYADFMVACGAGLVRERGSISELEINQAVIQAVTARMASELGEVVSANGLAGGLVCAGPRAAFPHGLPTLARPRPGDCLILSFGCSVGGYHAESERTFFVGEPPPEARQLHEAVCRAQAAGIERLEPGRACAGAEHAAQDVLVQAGYGEHIRHRLGHGLGLESHEGPWLEAGEAAFLLAGMVVSAEPGLYVPGRGGWRISDTLIVERAGPEYVTHFPRDLASAVLPWKG
jgi:Xaa-Pro aminopeptidase